jgi:hypothetical protein
MDVFGCRGLRLHTARFDAARQRAGGPVNKNCLERIVSVYRAQKIPLKNLLPTALKNGIVGSKKLRERIETRISRYKGHKIRISNEETSRGD